jgi:hypothetical protein
MAYGKQTTQVAEQQAAERGVTLFKVGDKVVTNHGYAGTIAEVTAYGDGERLFWNMCDYTLAGEAFGSTGMRVDFIDAHFTSGGCIKAAA